MFSAVPPAASKIHPEELGGFPVGAVPQAAGGRHDVLHSPEDGHPSTGFQKPLSLQHRAHREATRKVRGTL